MNDYEKDEFEREIERVEVKIGLSLKGYIPQILPALIIAVYSLYVLSKIPINGLPAIYLFKVNIITPMIIVYFGMFTILLNKILMGRKNIVMVFLSATLIFIGFIWFRRENILIGYNVFQMVVLPISIVFLLYILYLIVYAKTTTIVANKRFVEISKGVFTRTNDSTNLTTLQDEDLRRTTSDLIFGLGRIILTINKTQRILFDKLAIQDAERLHKYLKANSFGQSREYWLTKDRINNRVNVNKKKSMKYIEDGEGEEGGDEDLDPETDNNQ